MNDQNPTPPPEPSAGRAKAPPPWPRSRDNDLDRAFERLVGDRPSAEDRAMLYRVRDSLGIGPNDAIWTLLFAFQHYHSLYARFPKMIRAAAGELLVECKTRTDEALADAKNHLWNAAREQTNVALLEVARSGEAAKARLERAIRQAARRIALGAGLAARWPWVLGGAAAVSLAVVLVAALAGAVALGFGRQQGYHQGFVEGQRAAVAAAPGRPPDRPPSPPARGR
jgi:hypothetical protein